MVHNYNWDNNVSFAPLKPGLTKPNETGRPFSVFDCVNATDPSAISSPGCVTSILLLVLSVVTLLVGIVSCIRIIYVSKRACTIHLTMNAVVIVYLLVLSIYAAYLNEFWMYILYQFLKITVMYSVVAFMSLSVIRFRICPGFITQKFVMVALSLFYMLPLVPFSYTLIHYFQSKKEGGLNICGDFAVLMFASIETGIALILFIQIVFILYLYYNKSSISAYVSRQSRPIFFLTFSHLVTSVTHLVIRVIIYSITQDNPIECRKIVNYVKPGFVWTFLLVATVHLILPPWSLYWYFYSSIQPRVTSLSPLNFDGTTSDDEIGRADFDTSDEANEEFNKSYSIHQGNSGGWTNEGSEISEKTFNRYASYITKNS